MFCKICENAVHSQIISLWAITCDLDPAVMIKYILFGINKSFTFTRSLSLSDLLQGCGTSLHRTGMLCRWWKLIHCIKKLQLTIGFFIIYWTTSLVPQMKIMHHVYFNKESIYDDNFNCRMPSCIIIIIIISSIK